MSVGGSEQVNPQVFKDFHYTALGHLHGPHEWEPIISAIVDSIKIFLDEHMQKKSSPSLMDTKGNVDISTIFRGEET